MWTKIKQSLFYSLFFTLFGLLGFGTIFSAEVDSFTKRALPLEDSTEIINLKTNEFLRKAVEETNDEYKGCEDKVLYKKMRDYFSNQYRGELGAYIVESDELDRHSMTIQESIYQDFKWNQSFIQGLWGRLFSDPTASALKVNGVYIGTDKFEHFMGSGFKYFKKHYLKGKSIERALKIGERAESGIMGAITTGVKSYGDLSANFNGMRFWNHVLQKGDDVLGENIGPYVTCAKGRYKVIKEIDWANYIDDSYDEGINCSAFKTEEMVNLVNQRIYDVRSLFIKGEACPVSREKLEKVTKRYGDFFAPYIINKRGHFSVRESSKD